MNYKIDTDLPRISPSEWLAQYYESGLRYKKTIKEGLESRKLHRSYELSLFGNPSPNGVHPYRMDGGTGGRSYSELYIEWRRNVINGLNRSDIPKYLQLKFLDSPDELIEQKYWSIDRDQQAVIALGNFSTALTNLQEVIRELAILDRPETSEKPLSSKQTVSISLQGKQLKLHIEKDFVILKTFKSLNTENYGLVKTLMDSDGEKVKVSNIQINGSSSIKDLLKSAGITGLVKDWFIDDNKRDKTIMLTKKISLKEEDLEALKNQVKPFK